MLLTVRLGISQLSNWGVHMTQSNLEEYENTAFYERHSRARETGFSKFKVGEKYYFCYYFKGKVSLLSQAYVSESGRDNGVRSVEKNSKIEKRFRVEKRKDGKAGISLIAGNWQEIAISVPYQRLSDAQKIAKRISGERSGQGSSSEAARKTSKTAGSTHRTKSRKQTTVKTAKLVSVPKTKTASKSAARSKSVIKVRAKTIAKPVAKPKVRRLSKAVAVIPAAAGAAIAAKSSAGKLRVSKANQGATVQKLIKVKAKTTAQPIAKPKVRRIKVKPIAIASVAAGTAMAAKAAISPNPPALEIAKPLVRKPAPVAPKPAEPIIASRPTPPPVRVAPPPPAPIPVAAMTQGASSASVSGKAAAAMAGASGASVAANAGIGFRWIWLLLPLLLLLGLFGLKQCLPSDAPTPRVVAETAAENPAEIVSSEAEPIAEAVIETKPEPVIEPEAVPVVEAEPVITQPVAAEPVRETALKSSITVAAATEFCGSSANPIFNVDLGMTPINVMRLGTFPEYGDVHGLTPEQFYDKLNTAYYSSAYEQEYLDHVFRSIGYAGGFRDANAGLFSSVELARGSKGVLGFGDFHGVQYSQLNVKSDRDLKAFKITAASGPDIYYMKTCGNYMYVCR